MADAAAAAAAAAAILGQPGAPAAVGDDNRGGGDVREGHMLQAAINHFNQRMDMMCNTIGINDLEGGNGSLMMRDYANSLGANPPQIGDRPLATSTMKKYILSVDRYGNHPAS